MKDIDYQKRVLALCDIVLASPLDKRTAVIVEQCANDERLRTGVEAMLARIDQDESNDAATAVEQYSFNLKHAAKLAPQVGERVADFRLQERLGSGGMGEVYRATRIDAPFEQSVAIKILHAQILTPDLRLRFNQEREILARMHHPYIAGLIDGGTTEHGVPYLVMELVDGLPIDEYCDQKRLPIADRTALLEKVAAALHYAHQHLTIHRDIKPSNVLVTDDGIPKLVDFGIAKLITKPSSDDSAEPSPKLHGATTLFGNQALTPDYASPEQILYGKVSTASDVYSLGILAIQLITGRKPYNLSQLSARDMLNALERPTTSRASTLLGKTDAHPPVADIARTRSSTPGRLKRAISGDLDMVLAQATNRQPERRYASAEAFGRDLTNARRGFPVIARGDSFSYRTWSFVRTNRLTVSVVGATVVALTIGLVAALWQARIAEDRFTDLHSFARSVLGDIYDSISDLPGSTPTRQLIANEAQHYLDRLSRSGLSDPQLQSDLALAYRRLGDVQGLPSNANLGESASALANYRKAQEIVEQLVDKTPANLAALAQIYRRMADVQSWQGDINGARDKLESSLAISRQLLRDNLNDPKTRVDLAYTLVKFGDILGHPSFPNLGDIHQATSAYDEGLVLLASHAPTSDDWELRRGYSVLLERAGTMALLRKDTTTALELFTQSRDLRVLLATARPDHTDMQRDAGIASEKLADVYQADGNLSAALAQYRAALSVYERLVSIDPENANALRTLAIGRENLAEALIANEEIQAAIEQYIGAKQIKTDLVARDPASARLRSELDDVRDKLAQLQ